MFLLGRDHRTSSDGINRFAQPGMTEDGHGRVGLHLGRDGTVDSIHADRLRTVWHRGFGFGSEKKKKFV